jgi:hypothetical protein
MLDCELLNIKLDRDNDLSAVIVTNGVQEWQIKSPLGCVNHKNHRDND